MRYIFHRKSVTEWVRSEKEMSKSFQFFLLKELKRAFEGLSSFIDK